MESTLDLFEEVSPAALRRIVNTIVAGMEARLVMDSAADGAPLQDDWDYLSRFYGEA